MRFSAILPLAVAALGLTGCLSPGRDTPPIQVWDDMKHQPKYKAQQESEFFQDHRTSRRPPEHTIAMGQLHVDEGMHMGVVNSTYVARNPLKIDKAVLQQGQAKFNVYCAPCHSRVGDGKGIVAIRAGAAFQPTNLMEPRVVQMNDGELYSIASDGRRNMMPYRPQTSDEERWAIVAYLRALQRANSGSQADVPENLRAQMN